MKTLAEMQALNLPRETSARIKIGVAEQTSDEAAAADVARVKAMLDAYFSAFVNYDASEKCVRCGAFMRGILTHFEWALAHGEGYCTNCRWPVRAIHYIKLDDAGELTLKLPLQYHPDALKERNAA